MRLPRAGRFSKCCVEWECAVNSRGAPFGFCNWCGMPGKRFESFENLGGMCGEHVRGKAAHGLISFQKFRMACGDGFFMRPHNAIVAAGKRAGPGFVRA